MSKQAVLKIFGDIGESDPFMEAFLGIPDTMVSHKIVSDFLDENKDADEILVRINSRGGSVQEGWSIYDLLKTCGKKIITRGEGKVYSIATVLFLAGSEREFYQNADGVIHNPFIEPYSVGGTAGDLERIAEDLRQEEAKILDLYVKVTGSDEAKLAEYMKADTKLSAEDMLNLGFATKIIEPVKAFAYIKPKSLNMTPAEEKSFWDKVEAKITGVITALGLSRIDFKNMELTDKNGNKLTFEKESGDPAVGDKCTPDGTFEMSDGKTVVVSGGQVTEVKEPSQDKSDLDKASEEIANLKAKITEIETANKAEKTDLEAKKAEAANLVKELQGLKNSWKPAARSGGAAGVNKVDGIDLDRVKEIVNKKSE